MVTPLKERYLCASLAELNSNDNYVMQIGRETVTENQVYYSLTDQDRNSPASCWPLVPPLSN
jgi:hypothetical protein